MESEGFKRKLSAILSADVVGYSRLMRDDEEATVRTLNDHKKMIFNLIERNQGRLVDSPGDNFLAEFSSVVDAVRCAVQIQEDLKSKNEELPDNRKMELRIGINTGDVIQEGDKIYGDGVNVAARIESLAEPGGVCISRSAYDQVKRKLNLRYDYLGEHKVKNIDEPVRVYKVLMESGSDDVFQKEKLREPTLEKRSVYAISETASIAVLPFVNISSDPEQEYFVDGLSEEILNSLCQIPDLTVIARTSSFSFKGKDKTIQEIASVLGVENILEGSVRKAGNSLRITSQLVKAVDGSHLWSNTYNRELKDIFEVQEDIATAVADELKVRLGVGKSLKKLGSTEKIEAYELYLISKGQYKTLDSTGSNRALVSINSALSLDPKFAMAWASKSELHFSLTALGPANDAPMNKDKALQSAQKAIQLEPKLAAGYYNLSTSKLSKGEFIESEYAFRKNMELKTEILGSETLIGLLSVAVGYFKRANELLEALRLKDPLNPVARAVYMLNFVFLCDLKRAEAEYKRGKELFGDDWFHGNVFITCARFGSDNLISSDIVYSNPIYDLAKEYLDSTQESLAALRNLYADDNKLSSFDFFSISLLSTYFGDPEFAMEAVERGFRIEASGLYFVWLPVMREVRQLTRFKEFVREIGLVDYWNKFGWPDFCRPLDNGDLEFD